jgi:hypothetical protein
MQRMEASLEARNTIGDKEAIMMRRPEENTPTLLKLYFDRRNALLADLSECDPAQAADRVSRFIRDLERPYTDLPTVIDTQARLVRHALGMIATSAGMLTAVTATATLPRTQVPERTGGASRAGLLKWLLMSLLRSIRLSLIRTWDLALLYLGGIAAACTVAVVLVLLSEPSVTAVALLMAIGILAASGAATVHARTARDSTSSFTAPEPNVTLVLDVNTIDGRLSGALRAADELLAIVARQPASPSVHGDPALEPERVLALLQALSAHRIVPMPEKTADELAGDAIRLLHAAQVTLIDYSPDQAHLFDEQPAGITERRTLLPALVSGEGSLVHKGVVLVPVTGSTV